ncbi:proteophosphoglycan ppg4 [Strigomonas culicis]|uniref:Proteophosphoglycan ppg4 n=1 Tax=Strigomonas culicis TaxID=28005 RepID=S9TFS7_9TRYP|nr:proteophosphoglycan ppg4 [Strigomonas culicis]|eukprot:EPY16927.1 proteophosphoglycan ppg4 [Strigomonas culicis]
MSQTSAEPNLNLSVPRLSGDAAASPPSPSSTSAIFGQPPTTRGDPDGPAAAPSASAEVERPAHLTKAWQHAGEVPGSQESAAGKESSTKPHKSATLVQRLTSPSVDCSEIPRESIMVSPEERKPTKKKLLFHVEPSSQNDSRSLQTKASSVLERSHKTSVLTGFKDSTSSTMVQQTSPPQATSASCLPPPPPPHYAIPYAKAAEETTLADNTSSVSSIEYWRRKLERTRLDITYELAMESAITSPDRVDKRVDTLPSIILQGQDAEETPLSTSSDEAPLRMSPDEDYHLAGSEPQVQQFELTAEQTLDSDMDSVEYERGLQEHAPTPLKASFASPASAKLQSYKEKLAEVDNVAIQKELMLVSSSSSATVPETPRSEAHQDKDRVPSPPHLEETQEDLPRPAAPAKRLPQRKGLRKPDAQSEPARSAQLLKDLEASPPPRSPSADVSAVSISPPRPGTPVPFLADHTPSPSSELMMFPTPSMSPEQAPFYPNFSTDERPSVDAAGSMEADEVRAASRESPSGENREEYVHIVQIVYGDL